MKTYVLDTTSKNITLETVGSPSTQPTFSAHWADNDGTSFTEGSIVGTMTGSTPVEVVAAPGSGVRRVVKEITVHNPDGSSQTIVCKLNDGGNNATIFRANIAYQEVFTLDGTLDQYGRVVGFGDTGPTGPTGYTGYTGPQGVTGYTGYTGAFPVAEAGATYTPASGSQTVTLDCSISNIHIVTGNASGTDITFAVTGATLNQVFIVSVLQGPSTLSTITSWFATVRWAGGTPPVLTATVDIRDTFAFIRTGTNTYDGFIVGQNC